MDAEVFEGLTFTRITPGDVDALAAVMKRAFDDDARRHLGEGSGGPPGYDDGSFIRKWCFAPNAACWKVLRDGALIGAINLFAPESGENFLGTMFVDTPYQDHGYGAAMWRFAEARYPRAKIWRTETPAFAKRNHYFYVNKCGFKLVRIEHTGDAREESYILEKQMREGDHMMDNQEIEAILAETGVLQTGHFLLTSGRHSDKYMQCAKIQQYPWHVEALVADVANRFRGADVVLSPAVGAIIVGYELARQMRVRNVFAERVDGKMTLRRGFQIEKGAKVVVVEDTVTTGGTVQEMINLARQNGAVVVGVAVLVDRSNGAVNFGVPLAAAYTADVKSYEAKDCPLCREGKLPLESHGSRQLIY